MKNETKLLLRSEKISIKLFFKPQAPLLVAIKAYSTLAVAMYMFRSRILNAGPCYSMAWPSLHLRWLSKRVCMVKLEAIII